jgi:hypothetical protein
MFFLIANSHYSDRRFVITLQHQLFVRSWSRFEKFSYAKVARVVQWLERRRKKDPYVARSNTTVDVNAGPSDDTLKT